MSPGRTRWELSERPVTVAPRRPAHPPPTGARRRSTRSTCASGVRDGALGRVRFSSGTTRGYPLARAASRPHLVGIVDGLGAGRRHGVLLQDVAHDLAEHRAGGAATARARARLLDHDVDGEARLVGGREAGEGDRDAAVVALALLADLLGGAGLAGHAVALDARRPARCRRPGWSPAPSSARSASPPARSPPVPLVVVSVPTSLPVAVVARPWTRLGVTSSPPLASAFTAVAICRAFTETPCPKATWARVSGDQSSAGGSRPRVSPGMPTSVR